MRVHKARALVGLACVLVWPKSSPRTLALLRVTLHVPKYLFQKETSGGMTPCISLPHPGHTGHFSNPATLNLLLSTHWRYLHEVYLLGFTETKPHTKAGVLVSLSVTLTKYLGETT
jgi:hypothetical protein